MHLSIFVPFIQDDIVYDLTSSNLKQCCLVTKAWLGYFNPYLWLSMLLGRTYGREESDNAGCLTA